MIIRPATLNDADQLAKYMFLAMEDILYQIIGEVNPGKALQFLLHFVKQEDNQYAYQNCWVVEENTKVVAAINVYDGAALVELRQPVVNYLQKTLSTNFEPEDETQAGEYYIDTIGVDPSQQGKGVGTKLLVFIIEEYVHRRKQTLGLLVDADNPDAKRLYLKLGFGAVGKKVFFGKRMEHLQISCVTNKF